MTYRYFHTKMSRWRKRYRKLDKEASALVLQRATGRTVGMLHDLSRRSVTLGYDGEDLLAKGAELGIRQDVLDTLSGQLSEIGFLSCSISDLAREQWGHHLPYFDCYMHWPTSAGMEVQTSAAEL